MTRDGAELLSEAGRTTDGSSRLFGRTAQARTRLAAAALVGVQAGVALLLIGALVARPSLLQRPGLWAILAALLATAPAGPLMWAAAERVRDEE